jgi:hypothetical protein
VKGRPTSVVTFARLIRWMTHRIVWIEGGMHRILRVCIGLALVTVGLVVSPAGAQPVSLKQLSAVVPIEWQGELWQGRVSVGKQSPGPSYWLTTPQTAFTDNLGRLHLVSRKVGGTWYAAGLDSLKSDYGYGLYRFVVETSLARMEPQAVVGLFTFNNSAVDGHLENDIELSRWGNPSATAPNTQFVVQPWRAARHLVKFFAKATKPMTYEFDWQPTSIVFRVRNGALPTSRVLRSWTFVTSHKPTSGTELHLNLWMHGTPVYAISSQEVILRSFTYTPAA